MKIPKEIAAVFLGAWLSVNGFFAVEVFTMKADLAALKAQVAVMQSNQPKIAKLP